MADSSVHISRGRRQYLADLQLLQAAAVLNELTINEVTVVGMCAVAARGLLAKLAAWRCGFARSISGSRRLIFMPDLRYCWE